MKAKSPTVNLDIDSSMKGTLIIKCGECSRTSKLPLSQASPGKSIKCGCGLEIVLKGDDFRQAQRSLDDFNRSLKTLFK